MVVACVVGGAAVVVGAAVVGAVVVAAVVVGTAFVGTAFVGAGVDSALVGAFVVVGVVLGAWLVPGSAVAGAAVVGAAVIAAAVVWLWSAGTELGSASLGSVEPTRESVVELDAGELVDDEAGEVGAGAADPSSSRASGVVGSAEGAGFAATSSVWLDSVVATAMDPVSPT